MAVFEVYKSTIDNGLYFVIVLRYDVHVPSNIDSRFVIIYVFCFILSVALIASYYF